MAAIYCNDCPHMGKCLARGECPKQVGANDDLRELCKGLMGSAELSDMTPASDEFVILEEDEPDDIFSPDTI